MRSVRSVVDEGWKKEKKKKKKKKRGKKKGVKEGKEEEEGQVEKDCLLRERCDQR